MSSIIDIAGKLAVFTLRLWGRGRLPCAERLRRYLRRMRLSAGRRDRMTSAELLRRVPRILDDEWSPWPRTGCDPPDKRRRD